MGHTFCKNVYHIVFSTKQRVAVLQPDSVRDELYRYLCGIARNQNGQIICINGVEDHVHILTTIHPTISVSDFVRLLKANSSKWISEKFDGFSGFKWQSGYGCFSVSESRIPVVAGYIDRQCEHHATVSFADELKVFLEKQEVDFDPVHYLD